MIVFYFFLFATVTIFSGMLYGDFKEGEWTPPWKKKKQGVNSGAKFG